MPLPCVSDLRIADTDFDLVFRVVAAKEGAALDQIERTTVEVLLNESSVPRTGPA
ncbi:MAG: hypothetical protein AAF646_05620 [Pseudomonadota bacterium]